MIQPGMLAVAEQYQAGIDWVPTSMTAYLAGGCFFTMAAGAAVGSYWSPSGDAGGSGVVYRHLSGNITGAKTLNTTLLRFLQGISLCFIGAVIRRNSGILRRGGLYQDHRADGERGADCSATWSAAGAAWIHKGPGRGCLFCLPHWQRSPFSVCNELAPETATRIGEKLSLERTRS